MNEFIDFLPPLRQPRKPVKAKVKMPDWCKQRYQQAHEANFNKVAKAAGHYCQPNYPDFNTANGLSKGIEQFLLWEGWNAKGISSGGRYLNGKYIPGRTRRGAADLSATIKGKSVHFEIKIGNDTASKYQLKEQAREIKAGGQYYFVKSFEQFLNIYDTL